jgi:hypothetical protein
MSSNHPDEWVEALARKRWERATFATSMSPWDDLPPKSPHRRQFMDNARADLDAVVPLIQADTPKPADLFDDEEWGIIVDALIEHRASAEKRKGVNPFSTSNHRADLCADLIGRINALPQSNNRARAVGGGEPE